MTVRVTEVLRRSFAAASVGWALALPMTAWLASDARPWGSAGYALALATYAVGSLICHQRLDRSFVAFGVQLPVCARCTGLYVGAAVATAFASTRAASAAVRQVVEVVRRPALRHFDPEKVSLVASSLPTAATLLYEWGTGDAPANWIRAAAGGSLGAVIAWIVYGAARPRVRNQVR